MDTKKALTMFVVAVLAASVFSIVGLQVPMAKAQTSDVTIETSADNNDSTFFVGMLQVIIEDETTDDDDDDIQVTITVEEDGGNEAEQTFTIDDTNDGSQRFEFFLVHTAGPDVAPDDEEADVENVIDFGNGATDIDVTGFGLFDSGSIEIEYDGETVTIDYDESEGELELDRDVFGSDSIVYLRILDTDADLDPTVTDNFTVNATNLDDAAQALFDISGMDIESALTFTETSDSSGLFEAELDLGDDADLDNSAITVELSDKVNYDAVGAAEAAENTSVDTDSVSFTIDNEDGTLAPISTLTFGSELIISLEDNDANRDSDDDDTIEEGLLVTVGNGDADNDGTIEAGEGDVEFLDLEETGDDTGIFTIDLSNSELRITFIDGIPVANNSILEIVGGDVTEDISIEYRDALDNSETATSFNTAVVDITSSITRELSLQDGEIDVPETVGINDDFVITITEPDFNDNPRTRDSYTVDLDSAAAFHPFERGVVDLDDFARLEVEIEGEVPDFTATNLVITFIETGINTGIFEADVDMAELLDGTEVDGDPVDLDDGDRVEFTYVDRMDDIESDSSDDLSIGRPDAELDFSRNVVPIPPFDDDNDGNVDAGDSSVVSIGNTVFVDLIITDPDANEASGAEDDIPFVFGTDEGEFSIEIDGDGPINSVTIDDTAEFDAVQEIADGVFLDDIIPGLEDLVFEETGSNTGVFEETLEFINDGSIDDNDWQDLEFTVNYVDQSGDERSAGITFRGNDGIVSIDMNAVRNGDVIAITVQDEDLNLDDAEIEEFDSVADAGANNAIVAVETEDEDLGGIDQQTFTETGPNTGIFVAEFEVGTDIPVTQQDGDDIEQASNILVTYNDEVDSTGGSGDEIEVNVPVVSSTGGIQVTPELVGPGTKVTVLIVDNDLNEDSAATDDYDGDNTGDAFVSFRSSRDEAGEASPDLEETGPNTGIFEFEIELVPGEDCEADDVEEAEGLDDPSIGACPGDLISIRYEDESTANGGSTTISETIEVQSWDPEFATDKESYATEDRVTVTISDPDANRDPDIADSLPEIRVFSDTDRVGDEFSALETGQDTGVFRLSFAVTSGTQSGAVTVRSGDEVTVEYTDDFPADFAEEEEDKDFEFVLTISGNVGTQATTPSDPELRDVTGGVVEEPSVGQQVVLSTTIVNNNDDEQPFVALIEVRDSSGITIFLAWQTGTLNPNGQTEVGLSWTPEDAGDYTIRTFVISDLANPQVLSPIADSTITVSG